jgi:hypothetical protein
MAGFGSGIYTAVAVASLGATSKPARAFNMMLFAFAFSQPDWGAQIGVGPSLVIGQIGVGPSLVIETKNQSVEYRRVTTVNRGILVPKT